MRDSAFDLFHFHVGCVRHGGLQERLGGRRWVEVILRKDRRRQEDHQVLLRVRLVLASEEHSKTRNITEERYLGDLVLNVIQHQTAHYQGVSTWHQHRCFHPADCVDVRNVFHAVDDLGILAGNIGDLGNHG